MRRHYAVAAEIGKVVIEDGEIGEPGEGQLLLEAEYSTLSPGTEYSLLGGHIMPLPQGIGYSMAARVKAVGPGVTDYKEGDAVVTTGQHASYLVMDQQGVTPVPEGVSLEQAAFFNLAHTGLYAIRRTKIQLGEPVVVMGQGLVGGITTQLAKLAGACPLIVTDIDDSRLAISRTMGVDYAINVAVNPEQLIELVAALGWGGVPVVFEATGLLQPLEQAFELVSERGRVMMMSPPHSDKVPNYARNLMTKGATLIGGYINSKPFSLQRYDIGFGGSWPPGVNKQPTRYVNSDLWTSDEDIRVIFDLLRYRRLDLEPLISHRFNWQQLPEAYELVWSRDPSLIGGVISWK